MREQDSEETALESEKEEDICVTVEGTFCKSSGHPRELSDKVRYHAFSLCIWYRLEWEDVWVNACEVGPLGNIDIKIVFHMRNMDPNHERIRPGQGNDVYQVSLDTSSIKEKTELVEARDGDLGLRARVTKLVNSSGVLEAFILSNFGIKFFTPDGADDMLDRVWNQWVPEDEED
jgi:hypothetical protein